LPFSLDVLLKSMKLSAEVERKADWISVAFQLTGNLDLLSIPAQSGTAVRADNLWRKTCFEFFIAEKDKPNYWEFNFSPSGNWNCYSFIRYKQNMQEETRIQNPATFMAKADDSLFISANLKIASLIPADKQLELGISAVILDKNASESFWALKHCARLPDFHQRESFIIQLPPAG